MIRAALAALLLVLPGCAVVFGDGRASVAVDRRVEVGTVEADVDVNKKEPK